AATEKREPVDGERDALDIPLRPILQDGEPGDACDTDWEHRLEQPVPVVECREVNDGHGQQREKTDQSLAKQAGSARVFAKAEITKCKGTQNCPESTQENRYAEHGHDDEPRKVALPNITPL